MKTPHTLTGLLILLSLLSGCATLSQYGGSARNLDIKAIKVILPKFENATEDEYASVAMTQITASALLAHGYELYQTEDFKTRLQTSQAPEPLGSYKLMADEVGAQYVLLGVVHEYRYKTDLDGDPAVGVTLRMVEIDTGRTVWQGTSSNVGFINSSLTAAGQKVARKIVANMPFVFFDNGPTAEEEQIISPVITNNE
ncbi:MAG: hypothetical protein ACI81V_000580 [Lentimonas sp.]|jgi:hypothetical protein